MTILRRLLFPLPLLFLLLCACGPSHRERLQQLETLEARNSADSVMTDDSLATVLAEFFDDHGTPNERMRAHYILGRTYADRGEAPAALEAYLDAAASADTTAADCDWAKLSRVYGQMSAVYYEQGLWDDYLAVENKSIKCAWRARDTVQALRESLLQVAAYDRQDKPDSVIAVFDKLFHRYGHFYKQIFASYGIIAVKSLLDKGYPGRANTYLSLYERESGLFSSSGISKGKEVYYNLKGRYYLSIQRLDSAELFFRKELADGSDFNNQNMGAKHLAHLFRLKNQSDSAVKYAFYSYAMNDSVYARRTTAAVKNVEGLFNYSRHLKALAESRQKLLEEKHRNIFLSVILLALVGAMCMVFVIWKKRRKRLVLRFRSNMEELMQARHDIELLKSAADVIPNGPFDKRANELQAEVRRLQEELSRYKFNRDLLVKDELHALSASEFYRWLTMTAFIHQLPEEKWGEIETLVHNYLPVFYDFIRERKSVLSPTEYRLCLLLRLHIDLKKAGILVGLSQTGVSKLCRALLTREFKQNGSGRELKRMLESIV